MEYKNICENLIKKLKQIYFNEKEIKREFCDVVLNTFKQWDCFKNVQWKYVLNYSIDGDYYKGYRLGKVFKNSPNGIFDYIFSGISFGELSYGMNDGYIQESDHGIMVLKAFNECMYIYYEINMGGCPCCGMFMETGNPQSIELHVTGSIENIVKHCMNELTVKDVIRQFNY